MFEIQVLEHVGGALDGKRVATFEDAQNRPVFLEEMYGTIRMGVGYPEDLREHPYRAITLSPVQARVLGQLLLEVTDGGRLPFRCFRAEPPPPPRKKKK